MKRTEQEKIKKRIGILLSKNEIWKKIPENKKEYVIRYFADISIDELDELSDIGKKRNEWATQGLILIAGILIGVVGGLASNIIHSFLEQFGLYYSIPTLIFLILLFWFIIYFIKSEFPGNENKMYTHLVKVAKERKNKNSKKHK